jgi:single-strand DNA-binding protein
MFNATVTGNLGRDPDFNTTQTGQMVSKFSLAVRQPKKQGQDQPAFWVKVEVWGKQAEYVHNFLKKGASVCVTGQLAEETWNDKKTGELKKAVVIRNASVESWQARADQLHFNVGEQPQPQPQQQAYAPAPAQPAPAQQPVAWNSAPQAPDYPEDDEVPF